jgi:hypothetical protein
MAVYSYASKKVLKSIARRIPFLVLGIYLVEIFNVIGIALWCVLALMILMSYIPGVSLPSLGISFFSSVAFVGVILSTPIIKKFLLEKPPSFIAGFFILTFCITLWLLSHILSDLTKNLNHLVRLALESIVLLAALPFAILYSRGGDRFALNLLVSSGEDNAAWLENISLGTTTIPQSILTSRYSVSSGEPFGFILNLSQSAFFLAKGTPIEVTDSARILVIVYGLILIMGIIGIFGSLLFVCHKQSGNLKITFFVAAPLFLSIYFGWVNFASLGHLPSALSFFFVLSILSIGLAITHSQNDSVYIVSLSMIIILLLGAGLTWFPLLPIAFVTVIMTLATALYRFFSSKKESTIGTTVATVAFVSFCIIYFSKNLLDFALSKDFSYFVSLIHTQGATYDAYGLPLVLGLVGIAWVTSNIHSTPSIVSNFVITFLVLFISFSMFVSIASLATPPFQIDYAGKKLNLLLCSVGIVLFVLFSSSFMIKAKLKMPSMYMCHVALLAGVLFISPGPKTSYPISVLNNSVPWITAGLDEIRSNPKTPIVCLNTQPGTSAASFDVYFCNRVFGALQASSNEEIRSWAMRSLSEEWPLPSVTRYSQFASTGITVLVNDPNRSSTDNQSQKLFIDGWPRHDSNMRHMV